MTVIKVLHKREKMIFFKIPTNYLRDKLKA